MSDSVPEVLLGIAMGRADLVAKDRQPPFVVHLTPKKALRLVNELRVMNVPFGLPLSGYVPDAKEDDEHEWIYFGMILTDVHVYARAK